MFKKIIHELFEKFQDNATFEKYMANFEDNDPVQQQRSMSLMKVRNTVVEFLNTKFDDMSHLCTLLSNLVSDIKRDDTRVMEVVVACWKSLLLDVIDPITMIHNQDKQKLDLIREIQFRHANIGDKSKYLW